MSPDPHLRTRIHDALKHEALLLNTWPTFRVAMERATLGIVGLADLSSRSDQDELRRLDERLGGTPVLLATRLDRRNSALLAELGARLHVVWLDEIVPNLRAAALAAVAQLPASRLVTHIRRSDLSPWLRRALTLTVNREPPLHSVRQWAKLAGCSVQALEYHWRCEIVERRTGFRPKDFLDLIMVLRACELLRTQKPTVAAHRLGVHRRTLERVITRAGFRSVQFLREIGPDRIVDTMLRDVLIPPVPPVQTTRFISD